MHERDFYEERLQQNRKYQKVLEKYIEKMVQDVLAHEGIKLNEDVCDIYSITEYLLIMGEEYSIYQCIEDTRQNYPEFFKEA